GVAAIFNLDGCVSGIFLATRISVKSAKVLKVFSAANPVDHRVFGIAQEYNSGCVFRGAQYDLPLQPTIIRREVEITIRSHYGLWGVVGLFVVMWILIQDLPILPWWRFRPR